MSNKQILIENNNNLINIESIVEQLPQENVWSNDTTIIPTTSNIQIPSHIDKNLTVSGSSNLIPDNIKEGINIFNVVGTLKEGSADFICGTINTSSTSSLTINHNLGSIPSKVGIVSLDYAGSQGIGICFAQNDESYIEYSSLRLNFEDSRNIEKTATSVTFSDSEYFGNYAWIVIK